MAISMTGTQRTLVVTGIVIGCGAGVYALGTTQAHGATPAVAPATVTSTAAPGGAGSSGITVTGTGNATGTPDELQLSLEVDEHAGSVGPALNAANQDMTKVRDALRAHGIADADLQTSGMSVQPDYGQQGNITGYQVTESLTAVLRNLGQAGDAITAAANAAGNAVRIDGVSLDLNDSSSNLLATARANAMTDAKTRASQYASAAGGTLGPVISVTETSNAQPPMPYGTFAAAGAKSAAPISAGTQQVSVSVTVTYGLG
jgi:uncharacterized protein YggE